MGHTYESMDYKEMMRRFAEYILVSLGKKFTDEDIRNLMDELIYNDYTTS